MGFDGLPERTALHLSAKMRLVAEHKNVGMRVRLSDSTSLGIEVVALRVSAQSASISIAAPQKSP
jgi:hypothetical protein